MFNVSVKLIRSRIGCTPLQRKILDALGLQHRESVKLFLNTPSLQGMLTKVSHLIEVTNL